MQRKSIFAVLAAFFMMSAHAQTSEAVYVATYLEAQPASTAAAATLVTQYLKATQADADNTRAQGFREIGRNNRLIVIEAWNNDASLAAHEKAPHTVQFRDKFKAIQRAPYDQRLNRGFSVDAATASAPRGAIFVATHVDVPGPRREEAEGLLRSLATPTRAEAGHVRFDVFQQFDPRTNHFTVFEAWNSRSAFDAHGGTAHAKQFRDALGPMVGALYDERLYESL